MTDYSGGQLIILVSLHRQWGEASKEIDRYFTLKAGIRSREDLFAHPFFHCHRFSVHAHLCTCWTLLPCVCQSHHIILKFPILASTLEMPFLEFQGHPYNSEEAVSYFCIA